MNWIVRSTFIRGFVDVGGYWTFCTSEGVYWTFATQLVRKSKADKKGRFTLLFVGPFHSFIHCRLLAHCTSFTCTSGSFSARQQDLKILLFWKPHLCELFYQNLFQYLFHNPPPFSPLPRLLFVELVQKGGRSSQNNNQTSLLSKNRDNICSLAQISPSPKPIFCPPRLKLGAPDWRDWRQKNVLAKAFPNCVFRVACLKITLGPSACR